MLPPARRVLQVQGGKRSVCYEKQDGVRQAVPAEKLALVRSFLLRIFCLFLYIRSRRRMVHLVGDLALSAPPLYLPTFGVLLRRRFRFCFLSFGVAGDV